MGAHVEAQSYATTESPQWLPKEEVVWRAECEPLFPHIPLIGAETYAIGAGVTIHGVVIAHASRGRSVVVEVEGVADDARPVQITLPSQVLRREEPCTLYSSTASGTELVRCSGGASEDEACYDTGLWKTSKPYEAVPKLFAFLLIAVLSWAVTLATFIVSACLIPLYIGLPIFRYSAITWRWLAHRQLSMLLDLEPLPTRCTLSYPSARIPRGRTSDYASQGHTWMCLIFVMFLSIPLSMPILIFTMVTLPLSCALLILIIGIPLLVASTNIGRVMGRGLRDVAIRCIAKPSEDQSNEARGEAAPLCSGPVVASPAPRPASVEDLQEKDLKELRALCQSEGMSMEEQQKIGSGIDGKRNCISFLSQVWQLEHAAYPPARAVSVPADPVPALPVPAAPAELPLER